MCHVASPKATEERDRERETETLEESLPSLHSHTPQILSSVTYTQGEGIKLHLLTEGVSVNSLNAFLNPPSSMLKFFHILKDLS
jgi:hypothetical protein